VPTKGSGGGLAKLVGLRLTEATLNRDFFELAFDTRHTSTERNAGIVEMALTVYADARIDIDPPRHFADALQALIGSQVVAVEDAADSVRLRFDQGTIVASLQNADLDGDEAITLVERTLRVEAWNFHR
jgi:hypothetical protein